MKPKKQLNLWAQKWWKITPRVWQNTHTQFAPPPSGKAKDQEQAIQRREDLKVRVPDAHDMVPTQKARSGRRQVEKPLRFHRLKKHRGDLVGDFNSEKYEFVSLDDEILYIWYTYIYIYVYIWYTYMIYIYILYIIHIYTYMIFIRIIYIYNIHIAAPASSAIREAHSGWRWSALAYPSSPGSHGSSRESGVALTH